MYLFICTLIPTTIYLTYKLIKKHCIANYNTIVAKAATYVDKTTSYIDQQLTYYFPHINTSHFPVVKFIKEGKQIAEYTFPDMYTIGYKFLPADYDFVLYEIPATKDDQLYDKYIMRHAKYVDIVLLDYCAKKDFNLFAVQIILNEDIKNLIQLDVGNNHLFINGNILFDRPFIHWYLNQYHQLNLENTDTYIVTFIDHRMNYVTLDEHDHILIKKNTYDIIRTKTDSVEHSEELPNSLDELEIDDIDDMDDIDDIDEAELDAAIAEAADADANEAAVAANDEDAWLAVKKQN